jgi:hypothetical protein
MLIPDGVAKTLARSARAVRQEKGQKVRPPPPPSCALTSPPPQFREENVLELVEKARAPPPPARCARSLRAAGL